MPYTGIDEGSPEPDDIFKRDGRPLRFHLHKALTKDQQTRLGDSIVNHGGVICEEPKDADTIITTVDRRAILAEKYIFAANTQVQDPTFINRCLKHNSYFVEALQKKAMGGNTSGARTEFTEEDIENLATILRKLCPDPAEGGRTGANLYKEICSKIRAKDCPWAARHPWKSWMNYYKRHRHDIDARIEKQLAKYPRDRYHRGEWRESRLQTKRNQRGQHVTVGVKKNSDDTESESDSDHGEGAHAEAKSQIQNDRSSSPDMGFRLFDDGYDFNFTNDYEYDATRPMPSLATTLVNSQPPKHSEKSPKKRKRLAHADSDNEEEEDISYVNGLERVKRESHDATERHHSSVVDDADSPESVQPSLRKKARAPIQTSDRRLQNETRESAVSHALEREMSNIVDEDVAGDEASQQQSPESQFPPHREGKPVPLVRLRDETAPRSRIQISTGNEKAARAARMSRNPGRAQQHIAGPSRARARENLEVDLSVSDASSEFPLEGTQAKVLARKLMKFEAP